MLHKILVAVDQSDMSKHIFAEALALTKAMEGQMLLIHVLSPFDEYNPPPLFPGLDGVYPVVHDAVIKTYMHQWEVLETQGLDLLRQLAQDATAVGVTAEFSQHLGTAGRVICEVARTWQADLIVVGRRGLSGVSELLVGSVSNYVLHHAPCSVLTVQRETLTPATPADSKAEVSA